MAAQARSESDEPATLRLVIRAEIIPDDAPPRVTDAQKPERHGLTLILIAVAVFALIGLAAYLFRSDSPSAPASRAAVSSPTRDAAPTVAPATEAAPAAPIPAQREAQVTTSAPIERNSPSATPAPSPPAQTDTDRTVTATNEVLPTPSVGSLQTIRGTVRIAIRVTINEQGAVIATTPEIPGPSRYFERLATAASKQWTFSPSSATAPRTALLRFAYTREGVTASKD